MGGSWCGSERCGWGCGGASVRVGVAVCGGQTGKHEARHALLRRVRGGPVGRLDQKDHWLLHQLSCTCAQPGTHKLGARWSP